MELALLLLAVLFVAFVWTIGTTRGHAAVEPFPFNRKRKRKAPREYPADEFASAFNHEGPLFKEDKK